MLNKLAITGGDKISRYLFQARHFSLDVSSSQALFNASGDVESNKTEPSGLAPHPFEKYTLSLWAGRNDSMDEILVIVEPHNGVMKATSMVLPWGSDTSSEYSLMLDRTETYTIEKAPEITQLTAMSALAWGLIDQFRRMLAMPGVTGISGTASRSHTLSKGKRVATYTPRNITIDLDAVRPSLTASGAPTGRKVGEHDVRAHLCYNRASQSDCDHLWEGHADNTHEHARWSCPLCGGKKWTRKGGKRGDPSLGVVEPKAYRVKSAALTKGHHS